MTRLLIVNSLNIICEPVEETTIPDLATKVKDRRFNELIHNDSFTYNFAGQLKIKTSKHGLC